MLFQDNAPSATANEFKPADRLLWRSYHQAGWSELRAFFELTRLQTTTSYGAVCTESVESYRRRQEQLLRQAGINFHGALEHAKCSMLHWHRSLIGQLWLDYLQIMRGEAAEGPPADSPDRTSRLIPAAQESVAFLLKQSQDKQDVELFAYGSHLLGLLMLESCRGAEAEKHLQTASQKYLELRILPRTFDVQHMLGKLLQCQQRFELSIICFAAAEQSSNIERRARSFVDRVNTLLWLGRLREAWQEFRVWQRIEKSLDQELHFDLIFRGKLLFALVATRFGELAQAESLLCELDCCLRTHQVPFSFCSVVLDIVRSEHYLETGRILQMRDRLNRIIFTHPISERGYECFELLLLGSSCRQCVSKCWFQECWQCNACGCRTPVLIAFPGPTEHKRFEVEKILVLVIDSLRAAAMFRNGDLKSAEQSFQRLVHESIPLCPAECYFPFVLKIHLLKAIQARDVDAPRVIGCSNEILLELEQRKRRRPDLESDIEAVLGFQRYEFSECDTAVRVLEGAYQKAIAAKQRTHPNVLELHARWLHIQAECRSTDPATLFDAAAEIIESFPPSVECLDERRLVASRTAAWLRLYAHCFASAMVWFQRLADQWAEMVAVNEATDQIADSLVLYGSVAAQLECGRTPESVATLTAMANQRIAVESGLSAVAHELSRIAIALMRRKCFRSSLYFARELGSIRIVVRHGQHNDVAPNDCSDRARGIA
ncbi:MAG: hypothetical protein U0892_04335 [Pirellulales bacterium]